MGTEEEIRKYRDLVTEAGRPGFNKMCPIREAAWRIVVGRTGNIEGKDARYCLGPACAWWVGEYCAVVAIYRRLGGIQAQASRQTSSRREPGSGELGRSGRYYE